MKTNQGENVQEVTLQELRGIMQTDPREMTKQGLSRAIAVVENRLGRIPVGAGARPRYEIRLQQLKQVR